MQVKKVLHPVGNVGGIAVEKQYEGSPLLPGNHPSVQFYPVTAREKNILIDEPSPVGRGDDFLAGRENEAHSVTASRHTEEHHENPPPQKTFFYDSLPGKKSHENCSAASWVFGRRPVLQGAFNCNGAGQVPPLVHTCLTSINKNR
jgi:hypothetical protein